MTESNLNVNVNGKKTKTVVNMFAGPGAGKSTTSAGLFTLLKLHDGVQCELVTEFAKDLVWEERHMTFRNQFYLFAKQQHRVWRVTEKVPLVITDSPILLSNIYGKHYKRDNDNDAFYDFVLHEHNRFNNINFFIERKKEYATYGRNETADEALLVDKKIKEYLENQKIKYTSIEGTIEGINKATDVIFEFLGKTRQYEFKEI